jgi:hypothetical protein
MMYLRALNVENGNVVWEIRDVDNKQFVAIAGGPNILCYGLP